jgi:hypothetical protein
MEPSPEWRQKMFPDVVDKIDEVTSYRALQDAVWMVYLTNGCNHPVEDRPTEPITLGLDAVAVTGWGTAFEILEVCPERILILQTRSDPHLRWLAILSNSRSKSRGSMLRTSKCCDQCALNQVAALSGRWSLIL